ncbi:MAG TPA: GFA family protein [Povalibacter sp.]|uniref:GFA family protein n=1 Tax=Povalibacter sp. TaxID=1962978 RepID=UPI002BB814EA|nr:GFA family protein [Povalibacter sp.]HMN46859.1 GFA family protein [Povalibacter sp.]
MTTGTCLCGTVRYEVTGPCQWMTHCHCSMCRKHSGSLFGTTLGVPEQNFRWLQGEDAIVHYRSSPSFQRPFCRECGSPVPDIAGGMAICPAGGLADDLDAKPQAHIFVASKSPMHELTDDLRQFEEYPPGYGTAVPAPQNPAAADSGDTIHGSCLCGAVAFEIDESPRNVVNCHCSRCRQSRGTAHGVNFFTRLDKLRWTRGADKVRTYKVPEAQLFSTSFCADCGSTLPSAFAPIKRYIVPAGGLDTPLPIKAGINIWVGSRAPWFELTDGLPTYEEMPPPDRVRDVMF